MEAKDFNDWAKRFLWPFNLPEACPVLDLDAASEACIEWIKAFQTQSGLRKDGYLGPSTIHALVAEQLGGMHTSLLINGEEFEIGSPVARFFTTSSTEEVKPDLMVLLSSGELLRMARERRDGKKGLRSHFSIDASRGADGQSLIIQWADPGRAVGFVPASEDDDYPAARMAVGIELENPLTQYSRRSEMRKWLRAREMVTEEIDGRRVRSLEYHPEQIKALKALIGSLSEILDIPMVLPTSGRGFDTRLAPELARKFQGCLARFHFKNVLGEPGAGVVRAAHQIFDLEAPNSAPRKRPANAPKLQPRRAKTTHAPMRMGLGPREKQPNLVRQDLPLPVIPPEESSPKALDDLDDAEKARLAEAWEQPLTQALKPKANDIAEPFSLAGALSRRGGRKRNRRSRAEKLAARLKHD